MVEKRGKGTGWPARSAESALERMKSAGNDVKLCGRHADETSNPYPVGRKVITQSCWSKKLM